MFGAKILVPSSQSVLHRSTGFGYNTLSLHTGPFFNGAVRLTSPENLRLLSHNHKYVTLSYV